MKDGDRYCPSNGSEGDWFCSEHCWQCLHHDPDNERASKTCDILGRSLAYYPTDPNFPREWQYKNGKPTCTKFQKWDWNNDGDPDDPENPKAPPPPPDPDQLDMFPLHPNEKDFEKVVLMETVKE